MVGETVQKQALSCILVGMQNGRTLKERKLSMLTKKKKTTIQNLSFD